jgi:cytochrome c-type biogenesis protein CcmH
MFLFWLAAALLLLIPMLVILITLLKTPDDNVEQTSNSELFQQRLSELKSDIENGLLSGSDEDKVKKEYQLALLEQEKNNSALDNSSNRESSSSTITAGLLLLLIPLFSIGLYNHLGQPQLINQSSLLSEFNNANSSEEKLASVEKMLTQLEQRLINEPDDVDGWLMLTNSYSTLERYPEALRAVDNLYRLRNNDPTVLIRYADIMSLANGGIYAGKPTELINEALKLDPENANGLWLAGLAASERGDINDAVNYWKRLIPKLEEDSKPQQQIKEFIQLAINQVDGEQKDDGQLENSPTTSQEHRIQINVSLSPELINEVNDEDTVFIYAHAISGPPMPIAILHKKVSDLPIDAILDDSSAMIPNNKLSLHEQVKLTARISKSGNAKPEPGDLYGSMDSVKTNQNKPLSLIISNKLQ